MIIFPAIDIKDKECVRLYKGDFATAGKVADSYMETALNFKKASPIFKYINEDDCVYFVHSFYANDRVSDPSK